MKAIVECAGGKVLSKQPSFRKLMEHKQNKVHRSETLLNASVSCMRLSNQEAAFLFLRVCQK